MTLLHHTVNPVIIETYNTECFIPYLTFLSSFLSFFIFLRVCPHDILVSFLKPEAVCLRSGNPSVCLHARLQWTAALWSRDYDTYRDVHLSLLGHSEPKERSRWLSRNHLRFPDPCFFLKRRPSFYAFCQIQKLWQAKKKKKTLEPPHHDNEVFLTLNVNTFGFSSCLCRAAAQTSPQWDQFAPCFMADSFLALFIYHGLISYIKARTSFCSAMYCNFNIANTEQGEAENGSE